MIARFIALSSRIDVQASFKLEAASFMDLIVSASLGFSTKTSRGLVLLLPKILFNAFVRTAGSTYVRIGFVSRV